MRVFTMTKQRMLSTFFLTCAVALGQRNGNPPIASLKTVSVPQPTGLDQYVQDQTALVLLGKALFWDMQVGSDGRTACASCHFHAGADHRLVNQLSGAAAVVNTALSAS